MEHVKRTFNFMAAAAAPVALCAAGATLKWNKRLVQTLYDTQKMVLNTISMSDGSGQNPSVSAFRNYLKDAAVVAYSFSFVAPIVSLANLLDIADSTSRVIPRKRSDKEFSANQLYAFNTGAHALPMTLNILAAPLIGLPFAAGASVVLTASFLLQQGLIYWNTATQ